jgi:uncharacterized repeat protein (TIGR03803 family)
MRLLWASALVLPAFQAGAGVVVSTLHSFGVFTNGANPHAGLVRGGDGNFYGTTASGGTNGGGGTIFTISPTEGLATLYSFDGNDGAYPNAGLGQGSDGNLYGTAGSTIFTISRTGALATLYSFTGGNDGGSPQPQSPLAQGSDGSLYGTTTSDEAPYGESSSTVFKITTNGVITTLYSFIDRDGGSDPNALILGGDGNFYGTTESGGAHTNIISYGAGTIFRISPTGSLTTLYSFTGGNDGQRPTGTLCRVATAISMGRLHPAARTITAPCSKSAPTGC